MKGICSCEKILSSSLHGLIVSDAYQIPNCWIELTGKISGGHFKYYDYASSVNRKFVAPLIIRSLDDLENCKTTVASQERIESIQAVLISKSPFKLKTI